MRFSVQAAEYLSGRNLNMVFLTFILRYVESKFTLLTYLMENNTVITVISYCTKGLNNSKTKQKSIPTIHNKSIKSRVFNLTEGSYFSPRFILRFFFLQEQIFADRGQSAKFAKIRTRKIFMLHSTCFHQRLPCHKFLL